MVDQVSNTGPAYCAEREMGSHNWFLFCVHLSLLATSIWRKSIACVTLQCIWKSSEGNLEDDSVATLPDDDDVLAEEKLILSGQADADLIVMKKLTKVHGDGKVAVDNLSLGIAPGECFGLLGINGKIMYLCFS
jgi:hypothetical protein